MQSSPILNDCRFIDNVASEYGGGAVLCTEGSSVTLDGCYFSGNSATDSGGGVAAYGSAPLVKHCIFIDNSAVNGGGGAILSSFGASPQVIGSTMVANSAPFGAGVMCYQEATATIESSIIAFSTAGDAVFCFNFSTASLACSDLYGNPGGDWTGCIAGQLGVAGNLSEDPLFCDAGGGDLGLASTSPCAPENSPGGCGLIGALPVACGPAGFGTEDGAPELRTRLAVHPNPVGAGSVIEWSNTRSSAVTLSVYEPAGRLVARRDLGVCELGAHSVRWDDVAGALPPAVYFLELAGASGRPISARVIVTR